MLLERKIAVTFQLDAGTFDDPEKSNTLRVEGSRVRAEITQAGGPSMGQASLRIYGMRLNDMAEIMKPFRIVNGQTNYKNNRVIVEAGDDVNGMSQIFIGNITQAPIDLSAAPDTCLMVVGIAGAWEAVWSIPPTSYPGTADVAVIMQNLANRCGRPFEQNGVSVMLATPYLKGSIYDQAMTAAEMAHINWTIDPKTGTLAIWYKGSERSGVVPEISPKSGMIGYPVNIDNLGISLLTLFTPAVQFGGTVKVSSGMPYATGMYRVTNVSHSLDSKLANGKWETKIDGFPIT